MGNDKLTIYLAGKMSGLDKEEYNGWRKSITEDLIAYARSCGSNVQVINPADYFDFDDMERHLEK